MAFLPEVKQIIIRNNMIINNKPGIYEMAQELLGNLRLRILENLEISDKSQNFMESYPSAHSSSQNPSFVNTIKKIFINRD